MLLLTVAEENVKGFMNSLLREDVFDSFEVRGVDIVSFTHFNISAQKLSIAEPNISNPENDSENIAVEKAKYCKWVEVKPYAYNIIKGGVKPKAMKIIFSLELSEALKLHDNAAAMYLNLNFNGSQINFTTAVSQKQFALDKSLDDVWEEYILNFLKANNITYVRPLA